MNRTILIVALILVAGAGAFFYLSQPEPTPAEKLQDAMTDAQEALEDDASAVSDSVDAATREFEAEATQMRNELSAMAADTTTQLSKEASDLVAVWQETGIVTENGIDFDKAIEAVNASDLDDQTKQKTIDLIIDVRDSPEKFDQFLQELKAALTQPS